jgi:DNA replication and repair protein RecF
MLLDDVTSELDSLRRERLVEALREGGGQSVIATTDLAHVPGGDEPHVARVSVGEGKVIAEAPARDGSADAGSGSAGSHVAGAGAEDRLAA